MLHPPNNGVSVIDLHGFNISGSETHIDGLYDLCVSLLSANKPVYLANVTDGNITYGAYPVVIFTQNNSNIYMQSFMYGHSGLTLQVTPNSNIKQT